MLRMTTLDQSYPSASIPLRPDARCAPQAMISCVVPAFNEHENLGLLLPRLQAVLTQACQNWEVVVVDDGSRDPTSVLMSTWTQIPGFRYVQLSRNFGKEPAITAGLEAARGDAVIIMDADLQHPPDFLPQMIARWQAGVDMVYAVRENRDDESFGKRLGTKLFYSLLCGTRGVEVPAHAGDFRLMDRAVVNALLQMPERNRFMKGLYAWVGFSSEAIQYTPDSRPFGQSHFSALKLLRLAFAGLTAFTTWPLRAVSLVGFLVSLCSFSYGIYIVIEYLLFRNPVDGWPTIVTILLFFSGINLISLGIVGEYIARIFDEVKGRPLYIVRQSTGHSHQPVATGMPSITERSD
ncbi:glycosyltransferase family 2 protein [Orrella sp. NBD-18]|uniref:Glycosyltransferase family 2 protein n=2 Tax=Sheuella amnicola TaxID=2707330 RepID=A0A6B2R8G8_9BURK|nr:glycosyltransferase family 2 protein [Sheuella amnicola]HBI84386.1 glycosyltransferase [Alcaligenaceae bacterium]